MEATTERRGTRKLVIIAAALVFLLVAAAFLVFRSGVRSAPIVGHWECGAAMDGDHEIIPITSESFVDINADGSLLIYLDEDTQFTAAWEFYSRDEDEKEEFYKLEFKDIDGMLLYDLEQERVMVMIGDIMLICQK